MYRICKRFEFQAAHVLSKHPGRCRFPHGHSYIVDVTLASDKLDENDMVCDFSAIRAALADYLQRLDHSILLNSADGSSCQAQRDNPRKVVFENRDPSSEVLAREIFEHAQRQFQRGGISGSHGARDTLNPNVRVEKVRVWETSSSWAEYQPG